MDAKNHSEEAKLSLPSDREILIVRSFRARKSTVFEAWSKVEHLKHWFACEELTMPICEMDFRVGGKWRRVLHDPVHHVDHATSGEFREIVRPDRMVFTEVYEPIPGSDHLVKLTFEERDGVTVLSQRFVHPTPQGRDAHLQSGMERGVNETFARLDRVLASISNDSSGASSDSTR